MENLLYDLINEAPTRVEENELKEYVRKHIPSVIGAANKSEITLVEVIDGEELESYARAFTNAKNAEDFFVKELKTRFEDEECPFSEEDIENILDDGYYADDKHSSITIKEIPLNSKTL